MHLCLYLVNIFSALAVATSVQPAAKAAEPASLDSSSIVSVLLTGIPSATLAQVVSESAVFASNLAAALSAHSTPAWFAALPTPVQAYVSSVVQPMAGPAMATAGATAQAASDADKSGTTGTMTGAAAAGMTSASSMRTMNKSVQHDNSTMTSTGAAASSETGKGGGAIVTAGLSGVAGLVGLVGIALL